MTENRNNRDSETREASERAKPWAPPSLLPMPTPVEGLTFRYIRLSLLGEPDPSNVSSKMQEGWVPVKLSDYPELKTKFIENPKYKDNIVIGGSMLCSIPTEVMRQREQYYRDLTRKQQASVDNNLMRENDPRMPLFNEKKSEVTFGRGN